MKAIVSRGKGSGDVSHLSRREIVREVSGRADFREGATHRMVRSPIPILNRWGEKFPTALRYLENPICSNQREWQL